MQISTTWFFSLKGRFVQTLRDKCQLTDTKKQRADSVFSNQVLEYEHKLISQEIEQLTVQRKKIPDELQDAKMAYEIKMNMLVSMVQLGTLTMPMYLEKLKMSIQNTKSLAIKFKQAGRLDEARKAMTRIKLMTQEVEEVEQAQQEEE